MHDADDLDDATMLAFARETRLSETTFVQEAARGGEADYRNRIWTPAGEIPFAGHPSLGTAVAVARQRGEEEASFVQRTQAGLQPVDVTLDGDRATTSMLQEPAEFGDELDPGSALAALALEPADAHPDLPPQRVSTGVFQYLLPLSSDEALARIEPDYDAVGAILKPFGNVVMYAFHLDAGARIAHARGFCFDAEMGEDPATGSAAGSLMAYVARRVSLDELTITQGVEMERPSELRCALDGERVRVSGEAVVVADAELRL